MYHQIQIMRQLLLLRISLYQWRSRRNARRPPRAAGPIAPVGPVGPMPPAAPAPAPPCCPRRGPNVPRVRTNVLAMSVQQIFKLYRFDMPSIIAILSEIEDDITARNDNCTSIPPLLKLVAVLHFCATGIDQHSTAVLHGISQPIFSRILGQVTAALLRRYKQHIYMPRTIQECNAAKVAYHAIAQFPQVIGCIDCTHIAIVAPRDHEPAFRNRKMSHSMNVQMVCAADLCFLQVCARFPGSAHDARILRSSAIYDYMERCVPPRTLLLGDAGYPLLPWLMTPVRNPRTQPEERYNAAHIRTRNTVERAFGLLKSRFRCLDRSGGAFLYTPEKVCKIVVLCAILHNIAIRRRVPEPDDTYSEDDDDEGDDVTLGAADATNEARGVRQNLIDRHFT